MFIKSITQAFHWIVLIKDALDFQLMRFIITLNIN